MTSSTIILTELQRFMKKRKWSISRLSKESGINAGTLSSLINGNKIMAVDQLDRITAAMELPLGHYYESYIEECLAVAPLNWRRMKPFLYRCASLDKLECMKLTVSLLMDNLIYSPLLFDTAEDFFRDGKQQAALILYENVAASEWKQHSERLALCQYRIFTLKLGKDQAQNLQLALQFEPYVERLSESNQLEALKDLINTYRFLRVWDKVEVLASTLEKKASTFYLIPQRLGAEKYDKPLFAYIAQSYLVRANVCEVNKDYQGALSYIRRYSDMSWVKETDEQALYWVNKFQNWAKANIFVIELLKGNFNVLDDYIDYMKTQNEEMLTALLNITKAANFYVHNIDYVLQHYGPQFNQLLYQQQESSIYKDQAAYDRYVNLLFELAKYYLQRGIHSHAKEHLQNAITQALAINNRNTYIELCKIVQELTAAYAGE